MIFVYCSKCRTQTETNNSYNDESSNGRPMLKGRCKECNTFKSTFVRLNKTKDNVISKPSSSGYMPSSKH